MVLVTGPWFGKHDWAIFLFCLISPFQQQLANLVGEKQCSVVAPSGASIQTSAESGWECGGGMSNPLLTLRDRVKGSPQVITPLESISLCNSLFARISF